MTEDAAPHRTNDFIPTYDASAGGNKKIRVKNAGVIEMTAGFSLFSPADATTYYWGQWDSLVPTTTANFRRMYIQRAGIITTARIYIIGTAAGSAETSTMSLRLNNTTDTTVTSTLAITAYPTVVTNTSLTLSVAFGDYLEWKWVTPTWATNPTQLYGFMWLVLE